MNLKNVISIGLLLVIYSCNSSFDQEKIRIPFEISSGKKTATYEQTLEFCKTVAQLSPKIRYISIGKSAQGRQIPLLIIDQKENFTPGKVHKSGNAVVLIQANIHPGEPDGNDAGMLLIKNMIAQKSYPHNVTLLFLPIVNPDGLARFGPYNRINQNGPEEMGWRVTAQNLNMNRDFVKAESPEMQYWLMFYNTWLPDFTIDCHVTDGADYQYVLTYVMETMGNMEPGLTTWQNQYLGFLTPVMSQAGFPIFPYVTFRRWHDPRSGLYSRPARPMLSNGYTAVQNRVGLLLEAHSLKPFDVRVKAMVKLFNETIGYVEQKYIELLALGKSADDKASDYSRYNDSIPLSFKTSEACDTIDFLGVEYDVVPSELTGGDRFQYKPEKPTVYRLPHHNRAEPDTWGKVPAAFIVGPEWHFLRQRLDFHKIEYARLKDTVTLELQTWRCTNPKWTQTPFEGRFMVTSVDLQDISLKQHWPSGSIVIPMNQRRSRLIMHMLDPYSADSYLKMGFMNGIFEQREYFETYVMEPMARKMLDTVPGLANRFEQWKKKQQGEINSYQQLEWFYKQTPYYDFKRDLYPVGKLNIEQLKRIENLLK